MMKAYYINGPYVSVYSTSLLLMGLTVGVSTLCNHAQRKKTMKRSLNGKFHTDYLLLLEHCLFIVVNFDLD